MRSQAKMLLFTGTDEVKSAAYSFCMRITLGEKVKIIVESIAYPFESISFGCMYCIYRRAARKKLCFHKKQKISDIYCNQFHRTESIYYTVIISFCPILKWFLFLSALESFRALFSSFFASSIEWYDTVLKIAMMTERTISNLRMMNQIVNRNAVQLAFVRYKSP